ncbi:MAG TPA: hypothetical protein VI789_05660 [Dehalococcoidia bacterium]|nr:hypothetical protein [Dehalococcoidia bacterium]
MEPSLWDELREALLAVGALIAVLAILYALLVRLPVWPFLIGETLGAAIGISLLLILSRRRAR